MATVPSYRTWVAAETVTAAELNANIRDNGQYWTTNRPRALLRQTGAQSLTNNSAAAILFDTEDLDNDAGHSTSVNTSRYTVVTAGWYLAGGVACYANNSTGQRRAALAVNGTELPGGRSQGSTTATGSLSLATPVRLITVSAGDYIEVIAFQNSGGALNTAVATPEQSSLSLMWIGS